MRIFRVRQEKGRLTNRGHSFTKVLLALMATPVVLCLVLWVTWRYVALPRWMEIMQTAQLKNISTGIELFKSEFEKYPPSDAMDEEGIDYCGAMKLSEALVGRDLMGFHPNSVFRSDGKDADGNVLYPKAKSLSAKDYRANLEMRKGPYIAHDYALYSLADLYGEYGTGPFAQEHFVICDKFKRVEHRSTHKKVGMPILYFKADTLKTAHDIKDPNNPENIFDYRDNQALLALGVPGKPGQKHPLFENPKIFYEMTRDYRVAGQNKPNRADTYILLSAGWDGLYGTQDDIANFDMRWKPE